jgi:hypothetical protein
VGRTPPGGAVGPLGGRLEWMRDIFMLNEIRTQEKYLFVRVFSKRSCRQLETSAKAR